jgi:hypothetical protein
MYFQTGQVIFIPKWPKGEFVSILVSFSTKSLMCKDAVNRDYTIQSTLRRLCTAKKSVPCSLSRRSCHPVRTTYLTVRTPDRPSIIRPNDIHFRPDPSLCQEVSIQLASVQTSQQPVRMPLSTRPASDCFQVQIWED